MIFQKLVKQENKLFFELFPEGSLKIRHYFLFIFTFITLILHYLQYYITV
jgi:hypothetical protein